MRTYSRKKPEYQFIENVHEMCRLCLGKRKESVPLFSCETDICISLALRIMICVGIEISEEECLPSMICKECSEELNKYYLFRKKCAHTYQRLKSHVLAVKEMKLNKKELESHLDSKDNVQTEIKNGSSQNSDTLVENEDIQLMINTDDNEINELNKQIENTLSKELDNIVSPDISEFLSTILIKLEILSKQDELFIGADLNERKIELETGDGCQITLELLEREEEHNSLSVTEHCVNSVNQEYSLSSCVYDDGIMAKPVDARPQCDECGKRFATRSVLRRHALVHSGDKPFACCVCPRRFSQREVLLRHQLVHDVQRPFACSACPKSFTQRGALVAHARSHAPSHARSLRLHRCQQCPKMFLHASGLSRHLAGHAGRVHPCGHCGRQFRDSSSLRRHVARHAHGPAPRVPLPQPDRPQQPELPPQPDPQQQPEQPETPERPEEPTQQLVQRAKQYAQLVPLAAHAQYAQLVQHTQIDC